jgi:hypothetical protein
MSANAPPVSIRRLFAIFVALGVLFAPSVTYASVAMAPHHDMQMMEMGHCESPPATADGKAPVKSCCISMCVAVALAPSVPANAVELEHSASYFAVPVSWHGYLGEIATPPPRHP